jgi:CSLREA domain-containing protein
MLWAIRCVLIATLILFPAGAFQADIFAVTKTTDTDDGTCDPDCSLREAIDAANTSPGADDVPVPAGTYLLILGQLVVSDDVRIAGAGQTNTIIDGNATDRVFKIEATSGVVSISGVTIQNGNPYPSSYRGGGIQNHADLHLTDSMVSGNAGGGISHFSDFGDLTLTDSTVSNNTQLYGYSSGAGISNYYGVLTLTGSTVSGNTAKGDGGGIWNRGDMTLNDSTVSGNTAKFVGGGILSRYGNVTLTNSTVSGNTVKYDGGGIWNRGDMTLTNSTVSDNTARYYGGGIQNWNGDMTLNDSTVSGNTANTYGGGIFNRGDMTLTNSTVSGNTVNFNGGGIVNRHGDMTLANSTVSGNTANYGGGGISNRYGGMTLTNSTVSGNTANYGGGGISNRYGDMTLNDSTVSDNTAKYDGGGIRSLFGYMTLTNSTVSGNDASQSGAGIYRGAVYGYGISLTNTIVAGNGTTTPNCNTGAFDSLGYNLADDDSCGFTAPGDLVVADAMLGPLADNGGPTETHVLLAGSPAIDAGSPDCPPPATDQRGVARPQGAACDIGAFELEIDFISVDIDIKPGSDSNPINPSSKGNLPVAILGSNTFDVTNVDVTTLAFGPDAAAPSHDLTKSGAFESHLRDVNEDGLTDLLTHYRIEDVGIERDGTEVCLFGQTLESTPFEGCDAIRAIVTGRDTRR